MEKGLPNFFIVGAPKCGTTSLAYWLASHPEIYMGRAKEPSYFDTDSPQVGVQSLPHYLRCFSGAVERHKIIGDASPNYLFSSVAIANILNFNPEAQFAVLIRNPVDMVISLHAQLLANFHEDAADLRVAWFKQAARSELREIPARCRLPQFLQYRAACSLGTQLQRLFAMVPRERVCVQVLDDVQSSPRESYLAMLSFLGVQPDDRRDFPIHNARGSIQRSGLHLLKRNVGYLKQRFGFAHWSRRRWNGVQVARSDTPTDARIEDASLRSLLEKEFREEVELLSRLIHRDLTNMWSTRRATTTTHTRSDTEKS